MLSPLEEQVLGRIDDELLIRRVQELTQIPSKPGDGRRRSGGGGVLETVVEECAPTAAWRHRPLSQHGGGQDAHV